MISIFSIFARRHLSHLLYFVCLDSDSLLQLDTLFSCFRGFIEFIEYCHSNGQWFEFLHTLLVLSWFASALMSLKSCHAMSCPGCSWVVLDVAKWHIRLQHLITVLLYHSISHWPDQGRRVADSLRNPHPQSGSRGWEKGFSSNQWKLIGSVHSWSVCPIASFTFSRSEICKEARAETDRKCAVPSARRSMPWPVLQQMQCVSSVRAFLGYCRRKVGEVCTR